TLNSSLGGISYFSNSACTTATIVSIGAGSSTTSFYFRGVTGGTTTLTATAGTLTPATQQETIIGVLRTGTCTIAAGASSIGCTVSPPVSSVAHAMLFFQATSTDNNPLNSEARCVLASADTVTCSR